MEHAQELPPQIDIGKPLDAQGWSDLEHQDVSAYNVLFPKFNANLDWASTHCVAKDEPAPGK